MARVIFTTNADADIATILSAIEFEAGIIVVDKFDRRLDRFYDHIGSFPEACELKPRYGRQIRVGVVYPYSVFYRYNNHQDSVTIIRVLHGRRKVTRAMLRET